MVTEMRKNKLRILWAITALALLALAPVSSLAETNKAVLDACNSVVRVYTYSSSADEGYIGTGFAVGPKDRPVELIVTNCHVITDVNGNICDEVYVVLEDLDHLESVLVAEPVAYDATIDYAILSIEPTTARKPLALMSATKIERSETVYALGFPGVSDSINDAGYILPSTIDDITITRGIVSKTNAQSEGVSYIQSDCTINGGNSGGPLLTEDGVCIGINTFSATQGVSTFGSIYIDYVTDVLDEAGVPYIEGGAEASPAPSDPGEAAFWGIGEPQPMTNPLGGLSTGAIIAIGGVVVLLIISSIFMVKRAKNSAGRAGYVRKRKAPKQGAEEVPYETFEEYKARKESSSFVIRCVSGPFAGNDYSIEDSILLGRDASTCNIVYPDGTPGISTLHCKLLAAEGGLAVMDLDSSYGTFLADGTKLTPYQQYGLNSGDSFYLAQRENTFTVL